MSSRTRRTIHLLLTGVLALGMTNAHAADTPPSQDPPFKHYIGYHGPDGTQVYPNSKPPTKWDGARGENILWQTLLPFVGYGNPIVVENRVFVMSEPGYKNDFPVLACLDADSGKPLWQQEINHLEIAIPDASKRAEVRKAWQTHLAMERALGTLECRVKFQEQRRTQAYGEFCKRIYLENEIKVKELKLEAGQTFPQYNLELELDREGGADRGGVTCPMPCSDGAFVYVVTGWRQFACFDLEGNQRWLKWLPKTSPNDYHTAGGWRSPLLWQDLFIADVHGHVRAFDKKTGAIRWDVDRQAVGIKTAEALSPKIFRVGDTDLLWCAGPLAIRLKDGKPLTIEGWKNSGILAAVDPARLDTLYLAGGGHFGGWEEKGRGTNSPPAAVRFTLHDDTLKASVLWSGLEGRPSASPDSVLAVLDGKVYFSNPLSYLDGRADGAILDAATGKVLQGGLNSPAATPPTSQAYAIAGGRIYGIGNGGRYGCEHRAMDRNPASVTMNIFALDGKLIRKGNSLSGPAIEGEIEARCAAGPVMNRFSYLMPFTIGGDRIYVRGNHYLYCIGEKK